ncbi:substrate-binding domain-containing protein [Dactylosporangium darangshiense]|uniref:substrate-binding domain-containing protein n=1 Tax=Dactylosporangium darangshiense TaxID=579108 RepID=UPI00362D2D63
MCWNWATEPSTTSRARPTGRRPGTASTAGARPCTPPAPRPPIEPGDWSARSGYLRGQRLAADSRVTAVFCGNDHIALGVLRAFHEAGRPVPGRVSVVGFDDTPESGYFLPPLTTIHQDFAELGRRSVDLLVSQLAGSPTPEVGPVHLSPHLVVRASANSAP